MTETPEPLDEEIAACVGCERARRLLGNGWHCFTHQLAVYQRVREAAERLEAAESVPAEK